jgi:SAM-dependent methyltransferase
MNNIESIDKYLSGEVLIGDDYDPEEILQWFEDEREAYAELGAAEAKTYSYDYHALNTYHGYRLLPQGRQFGHACGFGSAYGDELLPIRKRIEKITLIDSSKKFGDNILEGLAASFIAASPDGSIKVADNEFDLITCFGVLHHIPNVSFVLGELTRCLKTDGVLLLREPTTSMGDWRFPRRGLTRRERGIPYDILRQIIDSCGLKVINHSSCLFSPLAAAAARVGVSVGAKQWLVEIDSVLCQLSSWNSRYHRRNIFEKFAPASEFYVLSK